VQNLLAERIPPESILLTGNTSIDAVLEVARQRGDFAPLGPGRMLLVTTHRRENWGEPQRRIAEAIREVLQRHSDVHAVIPMHPNQTVREVLKEVLGRCERAFLCEPPPYPVFVQWMKASYLILTDSGGIQEEAPALGKPVLVLREETERPEGVEVGAAVLVGTEKERIVRETERLLQDEEAYQRMSSAPNPYGDGLASRRITAGVRKFLGLPFEVIAPFRAKAGAGLQEEALNGP
jgi:UDP-N-acetylglucosamine 2-epimerase (non-hydrolysing)